MLSDMNQVIVSSLILLWQMPSCGVRKKIKSANWGGGMVLFPCIPRRNAEMAAIGYQEAMIHESSARARSH